MFLSFRPQKTVIFSPLAILLLSGEKRVKKRVFVSLHDWKHRITAYVIFAFAMVNCACKLKNCVLVVIQNTIVNDSILAREPTKAAKAVTYYDIFRKHTCTDDGEG